MRKAPQVVCRPQTRWIWAGLWRAPVSDGELSDRVSGVWSGGHGEGLRRSRDDATGAKLAASCLEWNAVNVGTIRARHTAVTASDARCGLDTSSADGCRVGRRSRSSPRPGKPVTWRRTPVIVRRKEL